MKRLLLILTVILAAFSLRAQQVTYTLVGHVTDEHGDPVPGATVNLPGSPYYGLCDENGFFAFQVPVKKHEVLVSCMGFKDKTVEFDIDASDELFITLESDAEMIQETVVVGFFERKANSYTGAVATLTSDELIKVSSGNVITGLSTLDPSFQAIENLGAGSNPNAMPSLQMRGQTGFASVTNEYANNPNQPLFILDGFETTLTKIMDLDVNLIRSVTLLKDATAKALYGSKGANGVVVVETKQPDKGKMRISYTGSLDIQAPDFSSYNICNAEEKLLVEKMAGLYSSPSAVGQIELDGSYNQMREQILAGVNTHWMSKPVRTGIGHKHSLYLEGGDEYMLYGVDLAYKDTEGVMKGSSRENISGGVTLSYRHKNLLFRNKLSVDGNKSEESPYGSFSAFAQMNPYNRIIGDDGYMIKSYAYGITNQPNPLWNGTLNSFDSTSYIYITDNFYIEWNITPSLKFTSRLGYSNYSTKTDTFKPAGHTDFFQYAGDQLYLRGSYVFTDRKDSNLDADAGLSWSLQKGDHTLYTNAMWSVSQTKYDYTSFSAQGFPSDNMDHISAAVKYATVKPSGGEGIARDLGVIASANYSYAERYLLDANYRLTGSSEFGANNRWGHFYSVGAGWNVHNEKWMEWAGWLDRLKLRASAGFTGSQGFSYFDSIATLNYYTDKQYGGALGSYLMGLANPDLEWQKKFDVNAGADLTFLQGRINARFDWYLSNTEGLVTQITTPPSMGFSYYTGNLGEVQNKGYEAYLSYRVWENRRNGDYFSLFGSVASNTNRLLKISNSLKAMNDEADKALDDDSTNTSVPVRYEEGASMTSIWAVRSLGIDPETGEEIFVKKDGSLTNKWSSADLAVCGDELPKLQGTFGFNMEVKGFGASASFTWKYGGQMYNTTLLNKVENANLYYNVDLRVLSDRWSVPGQQARFKSIKDLSATQATSRFVEDYNILSFASLNLYYDFRHSGWIRNSFLQRLKLLFYMNDIGQLSSMKIERGTDYPFARSFSFAVQATF